MTTQRTENPAWLDYESSHCYDSCCYDQPNPHARYLPGGFQLETVGTITATRFDGREIVLPCEVRLDSVSMEDDTLVVESNHMWSTRVFRVPNVAFYEVTDLPEDEPLAEWERVLLGDDEPPF